MNNKIAVIGWGSLIWNPRDLKVLSKIWEIDGPELPIEFARKSKDGRITLVIYTSYLSEPKKWVNCLWNYLNVESIEEAIENLRLREGCPTKKPIGFIYRGSSNAKNQEIEKLIKKWADKKQMQGVVWTDLDSNIPLNKVITHLRNLKSKEFAKAKKYILKTPKQIKTPLRPSLESFLSK